MRKVTIKNVMEVLNEVMEQGFEKVLEYSDLEFEGCVNYGQTGPTEFTLVVGNKEFTMTVKEKKA